MIKSLIATKNGGDNLDNKTIQRRRMMSYFIEATRAIIEEQGIDKINIRSVADRAGYNSATLYNYFKDLDDLVFFTSLGYLKEYALDLKNYVKGSKDSLEWYLNIWRCFCDHSFSRPRIYQIIFFEKYSTSLNKDIEKYYAIFPEELGEPNENALRSMLMGNTILERNMTLVQRLVKDKVISQEDADPVNDMTCLIYQGMLGRYIVEQDKVPPHQLTEKMCVYAAQVIRSYGR